MTSAIKTEAKKALHNSVWGFRIWSGFKSRGGGCCLLFGTGLVAGDGTARVAPVEACHNRLSQLQFSSAQG